MITYHQNTSSSRSIRWYNSTLLQAPHAMLSRYGGTSQAPFAELNLSFAVGDTTQAVKNNRRLLKRQFNIKYLVSADQVHGDQIRIAEHIDNDTEYSNADGLITSQPGVGLLIQQADCQAVLLHDPVHNVIAAVHNGWRGSTLNIIKKTINRMESMYQSRPAELRAVISPSLGPCCAEFIHFKKELPISLHSFQTTPRHFDFWEMSRQQLMDAGLTETNIDITVLCTSCSKDFFSYRRTVRCSNGITGRNGSLIVVR